MTTEYKLLSLSYVDLSAPIRYRVGERWVYLPGLKDGEIVFTGIGTPQPSLVKRVHATVRMGRFGARVVPGIITGIRRFKVGKQRQFEIRMRVTGRIRKQAR